MAVSATDAATGATLTGHLIGRQTWQVAPPLTLPPRGSKGGKSGTAAAVAREEEEAAHALQSSLHFDPSVNVNAADKLLRAQLLGEAARSGRCVVCMFTMKVARKWWWQWFRRA